MGCMSRRESQSRVPGKHEQTNKNTKTKKKQRHIEDTFKEFQLEVHVKQDESVVSSIPYKRETGRKTFFFE